MTCVEGKSSLTIVSILELPQLTKVTLVYLSSRLELR